jgi:prepilin-type N-terminal cleavage/methylation domain-containing protein
MKTCAVGKSNKPSGFTLIELAVVILIVAVALGMVLPQASALFLRSDLKAGARRLAGAAEYARSQAMLEGRFWELSLDLDTGSFWTVAVGEAEESDPESVAKRTLPGETRILDVQKLKQEIMFSGKVVIRFQPKGLAEPSVIHLAGPKDQVQTLYIKSFNGRVEVLDGYVDKNAERIRPRQDFGATSSARRIASLVIGHWSFRSNGSFIVSSKQ